MRAIFIFLLLLHGLIHLLGFVKGFQLAAVPQLSLPISKALGLAWLAAALFLVAGAMAYLFKMPYWPGMVLVGVLVSQVLIILYWRDARFGTAANLIVAVIAFAGLAMGRFEKSYARDAANALAEESVETSIVTETDIGHLPDPAKRYLRYSGAVGKPRITNFRIVFEGDMRAKGKDWFGFTSEQYNFVPRPGRFFFMKARMKGLPTWGYHAYAGGRARMVIKVAGIVPVVHLDGTELYPTETVTFFNDLCLFAPGALIDERIEWEPLGSLSAKATFRSPGAAISAILQFDNDGRLTNFISQDRLEVSVMKPYPFSTPVGQYRQFGEQRLPAYGEAVWNYPDGEFVYGKFRVIEVEYNVREMP